MRVFSLLAVAAVLTVSGCAISPERVSEKPDLELCKSYAVFSRSPFTQPTAETFKQEIIKRNLISQEEWDMVGKRHIQIGMSQCALYASWGSPDRENRSVGPWGVHIQHIFNTGYRYISPSYVYTENGKVRSWQN